MEREKVKAFKAVVMVAGVRRSLYHYALKEHNLSLCYSTKKSTPPGHVCFVFSSIKDCYLNRNSAIYADPGVAVLELWHCEGYSIKKNGWWEEMKQRAEKVVQLNLDEHMFLTEVRLTKKVW